MDQTQLIGAVCVLVDRSRASCLWFLRTDDFPSTVADCLRVLVLIQKHAGVERYRDAGELKTWLSLSASVGGALRRVVG